MPISCSPLSTYRRLPDDVTPPRASDHTNAAAQIQSTVRLLPDMVKYNDPDLLQTLRRLLMLCAADEGLFQRTVTASSNLQEPLLWGFRHSRDPLALSLLHKNLSNGWLVPGKVYRTDDTLRFYRGDSDRFFGMQTYAKGRIYVGDFVDGLWHGQGKLRYSSRLSYEGEFVAGQQHGWGVRDFPPCFGGRSEGIFIDGDYHGDPRITPAPPSFWASLFRRKS